MPDDNAGTVPFAARWHLLVRGVVQGIGFRPFVYRLARELALSGWVRNQAAGVEIEIEGAAQLLHLFVGRLRRQPPPCADIVAVEMTLVPPRRTTEFVILPSQPGRESTLIPPDRATCAQCLAEVVNPQDRRFRYPFANCTTCGPRFTIIRALPYERSATTMATFPLCSACAAEYGDPADRRFHAEAIACPLCGPQVRLEETGAARSAVGVDALARAAGLLCHGGVLAVQGLGGFHIACDASNEAAVRRVRAAKDRPDKPLAVMVATVEAARAYSDLSATEAALLAAAEAPIVLVSKRRDAPIASGVAPGNAYVGLMLPYTPLHHLLLRESGKPLVMTSGNRRDEPLCVTAAEAQEALGQWVDAFLVHDRPIEQRCDDSVFFVGPAGPQPIRRSRGYTPAPLRLPVSAPTPILALGAELKNTFCLLHGTEAFLSQHIGDLGSLATQRHCAASLEHLQGLLKIHPTVVAHDLHPDYTSSRFAATLDLPRLAVQHHHAHIAACLADNAVTGPTLGVAFDGTGYGTDGAIWGGEFFVADLWNFRRVAHFAYLPLPGGDAAIRRPYRTAMAYLYALFGTIPSLPSLQAVSPTEQRVIARLVERQVSTVPTSSCGRLFDAIAAIVGVRGEVTYEAQAAIELETLSTAVAGDATTYPFVVQGEEILLGPLLAEIVREVQHGVSVGLIGHRLHATLADIIRSVCCDLRTREGITTVALSGGCWQNRLLLTTTVRALQAAGFAVYTHRQVPTNDGGISLGQAVVAAARLMGSQ